MFITGSLERAETLQQVNIINILSWLRDNTITVNFHSNSFIQSGKRLTYFLWTNYILLMFILNYKTYSYWRRTRKFTDYDLIETVGINNTKTTVLFVRDQWIQSIQNHEPYAHLQKKTLHMTIIV